MNIDGLFLIAALSAGIFFKNAYAALEHDEVKSLPGYPGDLPSRHFSGYLSFGNKHIHYYFVEAETVNPDSKPVILWLNGGPGCSSLDGLVYENGPFGINVDDPTKLHRRNPNWASMANVLYFEAPVGVGFSYSDDPNDYIINDDQTALDNLQALEVFFESFPEKTGDFYITGESYAGVYVPTLAEAIMKADMNGTYHGPKLKGIAVGNGCTGNSLGVCGGQRNKFETEYLLGTALVSKPLKLEVMKHCNFDGPDGTESETCKDLLAKMSDQIGNVNLYDIYGECKGGAEMATKAPLGERSVRQQVLGSPRNLLGPVPCINSYEATKYLTQPSVLKALHVKEPPYLWAVCNNQITYTSNRKNLPKETYPALVKYTRVVIYNGDWDSCVPYTDNEAWTSNMGFQVKKPWHPWLYGKGQVGGYSTVYSTEGKYDFTFITIRGGRHEVPETAPAKAFEMIRRLLDDQPF